MRAHRLIVPAASMIAALACSGGGDADRDVVRGRGLQPAALPPAAEARVDEAAVGAAFERGPDLTLLLHPRRLPRTAGTAGGAPVPQGLVSALRQRGVIRGQCEPDTTAAAAGSRDTPRCDAPAAGYVVRVSDVFRVSPDTVQLYLAAERYATPSGPKPEALRFEKVYQLVGSAETWRVAREARAPEAAP